MYSKGFLFDSSFLREVDDSCLEKIGRYVLVKPFGTFTTHRQLATYFVGKYFPTAYYSPANKYTSPEDFITFALKGAQIGSDGNKCILVAFNSPLAKDTKWLFELGLEDYKIIRFDVEF